MNGETNDLLQYSGFPSRTIYEALDELEWVVRDIYEFEKITCALEMSFLNPRAFHASSFYKEMFVTSCVPRTNILECVPPTCDLCSTSDHNSDSCSHYV